MSRRPDHGVEPRIELAHSGGFGHELQRACAWVKTRAADEARLLWLGALPASAASEQDLMDTVNEWAQAPH